MTDADRLDDTDRRALPSGAILAGLALLDVAAIAVFALAGRASHGLELTLGGLWATAWPFLAAAAVAWIALLLLKVDPSRMWPGSVIVWLVTVAGGLGLRVASGETAAIAFIIVATIALGLLLMLSRLVARIRRRRRA